MTSVHLHDLQFRYGPNPTLAIPDLTFPSGRVIALLGPNGAGKSTLLRLIAGLETPSSGRITLDDHPVRDARTVAPSVAFAFQDAVFLRGTVRNNLDLAFKLHRIPPAERHARIEELAGAFNFTPLLDRSPARISVGEARRVNLARAIGLRAPVTLLDEPLAALDAPTRESLLGTLPALLRRYAQTTILVTHDRTEAVRLADEIVIIIDGTVRLAAPRQAAFSNPPDPETAAFLGYHILHDQGGVTAIAPGSLRIGHGDVSFPFIVDTALRTPAGHELLGALHGLTVAIPLHLGEPIPHPGATVTVSAPHPAILRFTTSTHADR